MAQGTGEASTFNSHFQFLFSNVKPTAVYRLGVLHFRFWKELRNATEDIPTQQSPSREDARIPFAHEDAGRSPGSKSPSGQGQKACFRKALLVLQTLKNAAEFESVYENGAKRSSRSFVLFALPNGLGHYRFGLTTSRKLGKAHERNRIRRRVREILRTVQPSDVGFDVVVNPRRSVHERDFQELRLELLTLLGANI